jgi:hypothetical protein
VAQRTNLTCSQAVPTLACEMLGMLAAQVELLGAKLKTIEAR